MPLLEIHDLHVAYGAIKALRGVSLNVAEGEIVTLIGANGAGKTTTLRAISALARPSQGRILYGGESIVGRPAHQVARAGLVHVPEGRGIFLNLTVEENLELGGYGRRDGGIEQERDRVYALFPRVKERLRQVAGTLSGGEQQMLAIGRALLARPRLLLLDEPSLGLAPRVVQTIFQVIREINQAGTTILLIEQNARMALQVAHRAYVLEVGQIIMEGAAADLAASDDVRKAYLGVHG
ncbi:MAG: ABC transporter ATP-binding protein [Planctomyces sp.]|nr:ABC transporter ATP-binding protein [Planctomyces sp.]